MSKQTEYRASNLKLLPGFTDEDLRSKAASAMGVAPKDIEDLRILRQAVDARKKDVHYVISCACALRDGIVPKNAEVVHSTPYVFPFRDMYAKYPPVVVGSGPAGIFCALALAEAGLRPVLVEQGGAVEERERSVDRLFETGLLDIWSNVQFGEGGAGTFSDGKLTTGTRDPRQHYVLQTYVDAGAPKDILYLTKPHIGTDRLRTVAVRMRAHLEELGGTVRFQTRADDIIVKNGAVCGVRLDTAEGHEELETCHVILAPGNGARATFEMLERLRVDLEPKNFAVGVRIEQLQQSIDVAQYGTMADFKALPAADYKVTYHAQTGRPVFSFCVCPGGCVVAATSGLGEVVTNGMSYYARDGRNINGALIVGVTPADFPPVDGPLAGIAYQKKIEEAAFLWGDGGFFAPVQLVGDFLEHRESTSFGSVYPTYRPGVRFAEMDGVLPDYVTESLREALPAFGRRIRGFDAPDAVLTAAETRTSSPVRILRGQDGMTNIRGMFPCGEGAGYAGGIMSAAVDGLRCAEKVCEDL